MEKATDFSHFHLSCPEIAAPGGVLVWVHPQPVSKPDGITQRLHSRSFNNLLLWGKKKDDDSLPPAHLDSAKGGGSELETLYGLRYIPTHSAT